MWMLKQYNISIDKQQQKRDIINIIKLKFILPAEYDVSLTTHCSLMLTPTYCIAYA